MPSVSLTKLEVCIRELVCAAGMNQANAKVFTDVYMRATLRGVGHHDIYDLPGRLSAFHTGTVSPNPAITLSGSFEALEAYDGDNGPGEVCSAFIMDRAALLAQKHGIGLCTVKNSNHFLSAAPYVERAAESGVFASIFTRTNPCMGVPGIKTNIIGNAPMGFAAETAGEYPLMLDICLAYASYGTLNALAASGQSVPAYWGADAAGNPTTDPGTIAGGGIPYPVGGHKGFGLSLIVEILTGVLSGGQVLNEQNPAYENGAGVYSQTAIAIKADGLLSMETYQSRISGMLDNLQDQAPGIRIPGQSSHDKTKKAEASGSIDLKPELISQLNAWADKLGVEGL